MDLVITVLGTDRPGIVAAVSRVLFQNGCNIKDVSQTILQTEFAGIFIISVDDGVEETRLERILKEALEPGGLAVYLKKMRPSHERLEEGEPFVITTTGPDRLGLVAGITEVLAGRGINIVNLRAVFRGGKDPAKNMMIYEVEIPRSLDRRAVRDALSERAAELGLDISIQHRDIFEQINRI
jgi:glycine cleavage system transcriptional repressor